MQGLFPCMRDSRGLPYDQNVPVLKYVRWLRVSTFSRHELPRDSGRYRPPIYPSMPLVPYQLCSPI